MKSKLKERVGGHRILGSSPLLMTLYLETPLHYSLDSFIYLFIQINQVPTKCRVLCQMFNIQKRWKYKASSFLFLLSLSLSKVFDCHFNSFRYFAKPFLNMIDKGLIAYKHTMFCERWEKSRGSQMPRLRCLHSDTSHPRAFIGILTEIFHCEEMKDIQVQRFQPLF